jgi:hypothetical protein
MQVQWMRCRGIVVPVVAAMVLGGCVTTGGGTAGGGGDDTMAKAGGTAGGAVLGAAIGAVASKNKAKGALIGGAVGALAGYAAGSYLGQTSQMKQDRLSQDAALDEQVRQTIEFRMTNERTNDQLANELDTLAAENRKILARVKNRTATRNELAAQRDKLTRKRDEAAQAYTDLKTEYEAKYQLARELQRRSADSASSGVQQLNEELQEWKRHLEQLKQHERALGKQLGDLA